MKAGKKAKRGRPSRAEASKKALEALAAAGVDPATVDPRRILESIAADTSAPASARVQACRALLADRDPEDPKGRADSKLNARALAIMAPAAGRTN